MIATSARTTGTLLGLTAGDLMTRELVLLPWNMPLRDAVRLLLHDGITGAPVVDADGRCLGVLSLTDIAHLVAQWKAQSQAAPSSNASARPLTCTFLVKHVTADGEEFFTCTLPAEGCLLQRKQEGPKGQKMLICSQPHCILMDWQLIQMEKLPTDEVRQFMTPDPVTVTPATPIRTLARHMIDAKIHRVIVVDTENRPIGIVTSTDIVATVAYSDDEPSS